MNYIICMNQNEINIKEVNIIITKEIKIVNIYNCKSFFVYNIQCMHEIVINNNFKPGFFF